MNWDLLVRRINVVVSRVVPENEVSKKQNFEQLDLFTDYAALVKKKEQEKSTRCFGSSEETW